MRIGSGATRRTWTNTAVKSQLIEQLARTTGKLPSEAETRDWLVALSRFARDQVAERWRATSARRAGKVGKAVCYLSMEFLPGRLLSDALRNLDLADAAREALAEYGVDLEKVIELELDPGLGNGGLGRLAACLLESTATLDLPAYGYGLRYEYGMFAQGVADGWQTEAADPWLAEGNPWEFLRPELTYPIRLFGRVVDDWDEQGRPRRRWVEGVELEAVAHDMPVPGFGTQTVNTLRLWAAQARRGFDLARFNAGDHRGALEQRLLAKSLTRVLYPSDATEAGRELRFKQEYFFASATMQDVLRRHLAQGRPLAALADSVALQINDTHPALAIAELMRLLIDDHRLDWDEAWAITRGAFAYTNHTLMPEALESWPVGYFETMLPRHLEIVYEINSRFLAEANRRRPDDARLIADASFVDERGERRVRMANLAFVGSHAVNGVSAVHTELMRNTVFADLDALFPGRIVNVTNGVTPRRWLNEANPSLARLIGQAIGDGWKRDLERLAELAPFAEDANFRQQFRAAKRGAKHRFAARLKRRTGVELDVDSLFDVQVKRIHEYKRQLLNVLHAVALYDRLRRGQGASLLPRSVIFAGKAAPGYAMAKLIIKLIHDVAAKVNADPAVAGRLKIAFVPNYGVAEALSIIPAAELSEQISTAGTEASGTGNMKLALNGALTIGTLDGANIEIREAVGPENFFMFGLDVAGVERRKRAGYDPRAELAADVELARAVELIGSGFFSPDQPDRFRPLVDSLVHDDRFLVLADFADYRRAQAEVETLYRDQEEWTRRAVLNVAAMGRFSSDRAVRDYAVRIWRVSPDAPAATGSAPQERELLASG